MSRKPTFKHRLEYAGLYTVFLISRVLPRRTFVAVGEWLGRFGFDVLKVRRDVALANLRFVFGNDKSEEQLVEVARQSYEQLGGSMLEFSSLFSMSKQELLDEVTIERMSVVDEVRARGKGAILVTGHFGNWELFGAAIVANGYPTTFLVKEQSNPLASRLQNMLREKGGIEIIKQGPQTVRKVLRALQDGHLVGILPDQDAGSHGVFVDFLGRPASTFKGPAFFAYRANVPIISSYIRRNPDGTHYAVAEDPIWPDPSQPQDEEIHRLTTAYTKQMEKWVLRYPEHYFWVHRRWKTQPEGAEAFVGPNPHQ